MTSVATLTAGVVVPTTTQPPNDFTPGYRESMMSTLQDLAKRFGVDRAVSYAMAARIWQLPSGVVTTLLIALCFEPDEQGLYYLILTLTGLQALADAGLINTLLHAASHEAANARFDDAGFFRAGKRARRRLASLFRFAVCWFVAASLILVVAGVLAGAFLLERQQVLEEAIAPLAVAMVLAGSTLALAPMVALLEGCNQVHVVNRFRLIQTICGSFVVWTCLMSGAGLWTAAAAIATQVVGECVLVLVRFRGFFVQLSRTTPGLFDWRREIWPLQWRIGVQSVAQYLAFLPILPVLFDAHGPELAGRYGMTWQVMSSLLMVAYAYLRTRSPEFGRLIAEKKRTESNLAFRRVTVGSTLLLAGLLTLFCVSLIALGAIDWKVAEAFVGRFLLWKVCVCFAIAMIPLHLAQCFAMYIRSQKFDPIWRVTIPSCLVQAVLVYYFARTGNVVWIAVAIASIYCISSVALAWMCRWYERYFRALEDGSARQMGRRSDP